MSSSFKIPPVYTLEPVAFRLRPVCLDESQCSLSSARPPALLLCNVSLSYLGIFKRDPS